MYGTVREPYRTSFGAVRIAVWFAVLNNKRITVYILVRYGSRSNTKKRTVKINGSVRFALPTVRLKNGTVTVAIAVKNGTVKKTENGTDTVTNSDPLLYKEFGNLKMTFLRRSKRASFICLFSTHSNYLHHRGSILGSRATL